MRKTGGTTTAITKSTKIATVVVVIMVALVLALLYESFLPDTSSTSTTDNQVSILDATLFWGALSTHSFTSPCTGDAVLSLEIYNPALIAIHITNVTLYGPGLNGNATTFVSLSNSCLSISESVPTLNSTSSNAFVGYSSVAIQFGFAYNYTMQFDNGMQAITNQTLLAQAE